MIQLGRGGHVCSDRYLVDVVLSADVEFSGFEPIQVERNGREEMLNCGRSRSSFNVFVYSKSVESNSRRN